jgi:membrane protein
MAATAPRDTPVPSSHRRGIARVNEDKPHAPVPSLFTTDTAKGIFARVSRARTTGLAAELAFWLFLAILPIAAVAGLVTARLATTNGGVNAMIFGATPPAMRDLLSKQLTDVAAWNGGSVGFIAAVTFVWLASSGVQAIFDAIELEVGASRPWWKKRLLAISSCVILSIGLALLGLLFGGFSSLARITGQAMPPWMASIAGSGLRIGASAVIAFLLMAGLYVAGVPTSARKRIAVIPGAIVAVVLEGLLGWGYTLYVQTTGTGSAYTGTLAVVGVTLMSLYLLAMAILVGVEAGILVGERRLLILRARFEAERAERLAKAPVSIPVEDTAP